MRIAQISPLSEAVPPRFYGGTERVVSYLTEELVEMGHEVTLFASGDSCTSATLEALWPRALRLDPGVRDVVALHTLLLEHVSRRAGDFDVLHFHLDYLPFPLFARQATPFVTTLHGRLDLAELQTVYAAFPELPLVSISDAQRRPLRQQNWAATIYHGLPENLLRPVPGVVPSYLAFLGRISPEKGPDRAIRIARRCGIPLKMAAKVDRVDQDYFDTVIRPMLAEGGAEMIGEIGESQKAEFLSGAHALLTPIDWPEPFGMVMIEAMACGTPVIACNRGSVPEIVEDGVNGFIVEDETGAVAAVERLDRIDRRTVRQHFEARFTARRMAQDYLDVYRDLVLTGQPRLRVVG
ncbi:Glycosyltransferase family 4 protein [Rhodovastum atsumiense]|uniref:Glycosyltransferase family 4 protein n=1 Tax=Rhodovastum atsumiense TaxID=504468 RepID=A0A5M6IL93_9PROT|nr:glycosyltransferase family 4 protein [Rhodovastum atsumiense]KAA5609043.1 glycosyltransferase family 4 protein [Rhodovastum atsumiense]CAH2604684.1 Glycosyltransferase family 4 protein [Rhodovastum atsumiense]